MGTTECDWKTGKMVVHPFTEHCKGDCVEKHENAHVEENKSCCARLRKCIDNAHGVTPELIKCRDAYAVWFNDPGQAAWDECQAYLNEQACLGKVIDDECVPIWAGSKAGNQEDCKCCDQLAKELFLTTLNTDKEYCPRANRKDCPFDDKGNIK